MKVGLIFHREKIILETIDFDSSYLCEYLFKSRDKYSFGKPGVSRFYFYYPFMKIDYFINWLLASYLRFGRSVAIARNYTETPLKATKCLAFIGFAFNGVSVYTKINFSPNIFFFHNFDISWKLLFCWFCDGKLATSQHRNDQF